MRVAEVEKINKRLLSLDAYRGLTMFLLVAGGAGVFRALRDPFYADSFLGPLLIQFTHHEWNGLYFWDLIQPFFMFIVGVAMPFAFAKRLAGGSTGIQRFKHVLYRSTMLFFLGVFLHSFGANMPAWELWNVLTQLSFTYLVAYLLMNKGTKTQIGFTIGLLILTELFYRLWGVPGFDQPFVKDHNFGSWMDMVLMGKLNNGGGWVAINCVPTTAHTMWGVLCGKLLMSEKSENGKLFRLIGFGLGMIILGYALNPVTPIIKRICTSSFVIVSGGWAILTLAIFYWIVDIKKKVKWASFAMIVGMNSIFIYMVANTIGSDSVKKSVAIFTNGFLSWMGDPIVNLLTALLTLAGYWYLCYWLYKRRVFIKI